MKKKLMSVLTIVTLVMVFFLNTNVSVAATMHTCAYSDVGIIHLSTQEVGSHVVEKYDTEAGTYKTVICYISVETWAHVMKCGCGNIKYENKWNKIQHSECGL